MSAYTGQLRGVKHTPASELAQALCAKVPLEKVNPKRSVVGLFSIRKSKATNEEDLGVEYCPDSQL